MSALKGDIQFQLLKKRLQEQNRRLQQEITDRKQIEEALKASQQYAQNIIESSLDMIIAVDRERKIIEFNKAAQKTFGYDRKEVLGEHINILYENPEESSQISQKWDTLSFV